MALMTKKELIVLAIMGPIAVALVVFFWPYPEPVPPAASDVEIFQEFMEEMEPSRVPQEGPEEPEKPSGPSLLEEKHKAAVELARKFGPARGAALKALKEGKLEQPRPYAGELPAAGDVVAVQLELMAGDQPAIGPAGDWTRARLAGIDSVDFRKQGGTEPDYELLASVLATLRAKREAQAPGWLVVKIVSAPFVPFKVMERVIQAAARAGFSRIEFEHLLVPD